MRWPFQRCRAETEVLRREMDNAFQFVHWRINKLKENMMTESQRLQALLDAVNAHNVADAAFQTNVNADIANLKAQITTGENPAVDALLTSLETAVANKPVLTLPTDAPVNTPTTPDSP